MNSDVSSAASSSRAVRMRMETAVRTGSARSRTRRPVVVTESPVALSDAGDARAREQEHPGEEEEDGDDMGADVAEQRGMPSWSHSPTCPPRSSLASASPPRPNVPAAKARQEESSRHAAAARNGRTAGSTGRMHDQRAGGEQPDRHEHVDLADQVLQAVDDAVPTVPPSQPR